MSFFKWFNNYKLVFLITNQFKMKKIIFVLFALLTFIHSHSQEGNYLTINFYKVADGKTQEYEKLMTEYISKIQEERIKSGCLSSWVFRRVLPSSKMSNEISHITIDIRTKEQTENDCNWNPYNSIPEISEYLHEVILEKHRSNRKLVYNTQLMEVAGYNKLSEAPNVAVFNLIKANNVSNYAKRHREWQNNAFQKHSSQVAWHALMRNDIIGAGDNEWNYLSIDLFNNLEEANNRKWTIPQKEMNLANKKYGSNQDMRVIKDKIIATLISSL